MLSPSALEACSTRHSTVQVERAGSIIDVETRNLCARTGHREVRRRSVVEQDRMISCAIAHVVVALMIRVEMVFARIRPWPITSRLHAVERIHHPLMSTGTVVGSLARIDDAICYIVAVDMERELIPTGPLSLDVRSRSIGYEYPLAGLLVGCSRTGRDLDATSIHNSRISAPCLAKRSTRNDSCAELPI